MDLSKLQLYLKFWNASPKHVHTKVYGMSKQKFIAALLSCQNLKANLVFERCLSIRKWLICGTPMSWNIIQ